MLTPKEKAIQLVDRFDNIDVLGEEHNGYIAQQCALVALDLLLYYSESPEAFIEFEEIKKEIEELL